MNEQEFKQRTKKLALRIIHVVEALPQTSTAQIIGKQLLRFWILDFGFWIVPIPSSESLDI